MNNDTVSGKFDQLKGKIKQTVGEAAGDQSMANSGAADQVKGAAKESWGSVKDAVNRPATTGTTTDSDDSLAADSSRTAHNVREKMISTAQNAKESVKEKTDDVNYRRSA
jgi:uncharacterized protein YjbJ (UPF0337 family)